MVSNLLDARRITATRAAGRLYALGVRRVWIFGSLARNDHHDPRSDIDLAVEGIPTHVSRRELRWAMRGLPGRIDLIFLDTVVPELREAVLSARKLIEVSDKEDEWPRSPQLTDLPEPPSHAAPLWHQRLVRVVSLLRTAAPRRVLDLGCGTGSLVVRLVRDEAIRRVTAVDASIRALQRGKQKVGRFARPRSNDVTWIHGLITHPDPRFLGHDAAVLVEVLEHLDVPRRRSLATVLFDHLDVRTVLITTPNADYNPRFGLGGGNRLRHPDHVVEFSRAGFESWIRRHAPTHEWDARFLGAGREDAELGQPTQICLLRRR